MQRTVRTFLAAILAAPLLATPAQATFPGENGKLALDTFLGGFKVRTVNPDGSELTQLTSGLAGGIIEDTAQPSWSPDGRRIAFASHVRETQVWKLEVMAADGSGRTSIFENNEGIGSPTWSPDGTRILFTVGGRALAFGESFNVIDALGGTPAPVPLSGVKVPDRVSHPDWSPDGTRFVFAGQTFRFFCDPADPPECFRGLTSPALYLAQADGSGLRALTGSTDNTYPSWSPDGTRLVYRGERRLRILNPDTGAIGQTEIDGYWPVWSPDGRRIAFATLWAGASRPGGVHVMNPDGSDPVRILHSGIGFGDDPQYQDSSWQPIPNRPPDCTAVEASPQPLWPPNGTLRLVALSGATDPDGDPVTLEVTGVTQDEPRGATQDAFPAAGADSVRLRAERTGSGDGRVYRIAFSGSDGRGGACSGTALVGVPHDRARGPVDSAPPSHDSFGL